MHSPLALTIIYTNALHIRYEKKKKHRLKNYSFNLFEGQRDYYCDYLLFLCYFVYINPRKVKVDWFFAFYFYMYTLTIRFNNAMPILYICIRPTRSTYMVSVVKLYIFILHILFVITILYYIKLYIFYLYAIHPIQLCSYTKKQNKKEKKIAISKLLKSYSFFLFFSFHHKFQVEHFCIFEFFIEYYYNIGLYIG